MNKNVLVHLRKLEAAASPGPWVYNSYSLIASVPKFREHHNFVARHEAAGAPWSFDGDYPEPWKSQEPVPDVCSVPVRAGDTATDQGQHDAELIVAIRNALPELLALAEEIEAG